MGVATTIASGGALAPVTAPMAVVGAGAAAVGVGAALVRKTTAEGETYSSNSSHAEGVTEGTSEGTSETSTETKSLTSGTSNNMQLTMQNKSIINILERIDLQLKRLQECESLGMWECAAYFLSDSQESAEMAASTYKALMKGENS